MGWPTSPDFWKSFAPAEGRTLASQILATILRAILFTIWFQKYKKVHKGDSITRIRTRINYFFLKLFKEYGLHFRIISRATYSVLFVYSIFPLNSLRGWLRLSLPSNIAIRSSLSNCLNCLNCLNKAFSKWMKLVYSKIIVVLLVHAYGHKGSIIQINFKWFFPKLN